VTASEKKIEI